MKLKTPLETWLKKYESYKDEITLDLIRGTWHFIVSADQISFILETAPVYGTLHILIH